MCFDEIHQLCTTCSLETTTLVGCVVLRGELVWLAQTRLVYKSGSIGAVTSRFSRQKTKRISRCNKQKTERISRCNKQKTLSITRKYKHSTRSTAHKKRRASKSYAIVPIAHKKMFGHGYRCTINNKPKRLFSTRGEISRSESTEVVASTRHPRRGVDRPRQ